MKTLLILRHGKSSWKEEGLADHERPLAARGKRESLRMGEELARRRLVPDLVVSSPAKRARSTARRVIKASGYAGELLLEPRFYLTDLGTCLAALAALPQEAGMVLIIGHNPLWEELVYHLTRQPVHLPTAALAVVDLPIHTWAYLQRPQTSRAKLLAVVDLPIHTWADMTSSGEGSLRLLLDPKTLTVSQNDI